MAITPEVKAAVDNLLNDWDASGGKGGAQRVLRNFSSAANSVPANTSGATDEQRLGYALDVLKAFKEGGWAFSTKGYQGYMGKVVPLVQAYAPAQNIFPLWKSTSGMPITRYGGGPDDAYTYEEPAGVNYAQWEGIAKQLGYNGPIYGTVGYDIEGGGITGIDPQFASFVDQKRAEGYDFVQYQPDLRNYRQKYGFRLPDGQIVGEYYGEGRDADITSFFTQFVLPSVGAYFGVQALGNALTPVTNALTGNAAALAGGSADLIPGVMGGGQFSGAAAAPYTGLGEALSAADLAGLSPDITGGLSGITAPEGVAAITEPYITAAEPHLTSPAMDPSFNPYTADLPSVDPEMARLYRQQEVARAGSALGGIGPGATALPGVNVSGTNFFDPLKKFIDAPGLDTLGSLLTSNLGKTGLAGLAAYLAAKERLPQRGGGTKQAYQGPAPLQRTMVQGKYGPLAQYAAQGGLMHAYAHGGHVNMEDGGFVMTKRAVDGAGGPRGLAALVPGVRPIRGPGTGTSDSIPATIHGAKGQTPARVSNGEAYVPRETVQRMGGARQMYNLMNNLQRRA